MNLVLVLALTGHEYPQIGQDGEVLFDGVPSLAVSVHPSASWRDENDQVAEDSVQVLIRLDLDTLMAKQYPVEQFSVL
jgi:hypothetical protein